MTFTFILGLLCSALIGLSLGLIGGGGSIITLPVLVYLLGVDPHPAMGLALGVVGATSLFSAGLHYRNRNVNLRVALAFAGAGIVGAFYGSRLTYLLSPPALMLSFAFIMIVVSGRMLLRWRARSDEPAPQAQPHWLRLLPAGLAVGVLTGFLGVGGGFLIVPALVLFAGLGMKQAVGTSLLVIAINSASALAGHMQRASFDWRLGVLVTLIALGGAVVGTRIAHKTKPETLAKFFAVFVLAVALFLIARNLPLVL